MKRRWVCFCVGLAAVAACVSPALADDEKSAVSPNRLKLPKGPGSLEGVGENVEPNLSMGLMSYGIPIDLPAGHNGHSPSLRLAYSSGAGNSAVGIGWSLAVPSIERMTVRGLPRYGADDLVAAGGSDELVAVERGPDHIVYRARFEGGFVRYTWFHPGSGGYWLAEYPDGKRGYFGATHDGRTVDTANVAGGLGTFRWELVELVDTLDHRVVYEYERNQWGESRPRTIRWVERPDGTFRYGVRLDYENRPDILSDAKTGFDLRSDKRLSRITVLHDNRQMRSWGLTYAAGASVSRLVGVERYGTENDRAFPVVFTFRYTGDLGDCGAGECQFPRLGTVPRGLPRGFATGEADFIDINGDALPDVLDTTDHQHRFSLNRGEAEAAVVDFDQLELSDLAVGFSLADGGVQPVDFDGNGTSDLLIATGADARVLWNDGRGDWAGIDLVDAAALPDFHRNGDALRFVDLDHDRRIDILSSTGSGTSVFFNTREPGETPTYAAPVLTQDDLGVDFSAARGLTMADMNGDGMPDPVEWLHTGAIYRLNLGRGRFSDDWIEMHSEDVRDIPEGAQLVDLNGDALTDLVLVDSGAVTVWLNRNGRAFAPALVIDDALLAPADAGHIPEVVPGRSHRFVDLNGNGSTDVVWIDDSGATTYLDLFPVRPNLLARIDNGIGDVIEMTYGSSTAHALAEGADSRLPSPGITVDSIVRTTAQVDPTWVAPHTQTFHYASGLYDGLEHQFRGFERVRVEVPGDAYTEQSIAEHVFDVGRTADPDRPDAYRKGLLISREVFSGEGMAARLIDRSESTYGDCDLAGVPAGADPPIRWICQTASAKTLFETPTGARPGDGPDPVRTEENYDYDGYGNRTRTEKLGKVAIGDAACGAACLGDELYEETTFVDPADAGDRWLLRAPCVTRTYGRPGSDVQTETRTYYDGPPHQGAPACTLTVGLKTRVTQRRIEGSDDTIASERNAYDAHGNVVETRDANDHRRTFEYDPDALLPVAETAWLGAPGQPARYGLVTRVTYEPVLDLVDSSIDWRLVRGGAAEGGVFTTRYDYDQFGRLTGIQHPDDAEGLPSETWTYDVRAPVSRILKQARTGVGGGYDLAQVQCFDGRGRAFGNIGRITRGRALASGFTRPNTLAAAAQTYQPFEQATEDCTAPPAATPYLRSSYDGQGRLSATLEPDGSATRNEYRPLEVAAFDEEDTDEDSDHFNTPTRTFTDGLGRTIRIERIAIPRDGPIPLRLTYDELGRLRGYVDSEGHEKVQTYDLLGRVLRVDDPDSGRTTFEYDAVGNRRAVIDARGAAVRTEFDELNRPVSEYATWPATGEVRADTEVRTEYDDEALCAASPAAAGTCTHVAGRTARVTYPLFGLPGRTGEDAFGYDARGQAVRTVRRLDRHLFAFETRYDSAGRVTANVFPDGEQIDQTLDGLGRLTGVPGYLESVTYDTRGLPTRITHVGGLSETHEYDLRLREVAYGATSPRAGPVTQRRLTRTPTGNITRIDDALARADRPSGNAEYTYDSLYRLTSARLDLGASAAERLDWQYDDLDRINSATSDRPGSRAHVGAYGYGEAAGPNAVTHTDDGQGNVTRYRYDDAGFMTLHGQDAYLWDARGRLLLVRRDRTELGKSAYGPGVDRVAKLEAGHVTWYPHPAFEVRDGVSTKYVSLGSRRVVKIERAAPAGEWLSDLAPAEVVAGVATPRVDGGIDGGDAWMALAVETGVFEMDDAVVRDDVEVLLNAAARRAALGDSRKVTRLLHDHLGTVVATTDEDGVLQARVEHYPYGLERWSSDGRGEPYEYTGKEFDEGTGLTYFGARYLEPRLGRWVSPDPISSSLADPDAGDLPQLQQRLAYCGGNPADRTDGGGRWFAQAYGAVVGAMDAVLEYQAANDAAGQKVSPSMAVFEGIKGAVKGALDPVGATLDLATGASGRKVADAIGSGANRVARLGGSSERDAAHAGILVADVLKVTSDKLAIVKGVKDIVDAFKPGKAAIQSIGGRLSAAATALESGGVIKSIESVGRVVGAATKIRNLGEAAATTAGAVSDLVSDTKQLMSDATPARDSKVAK